MLELREREGVVFDLAQRTNQAVAAFVDTALCLGNIHQHSNRRFAQATLAHFAAQFFDATIDECEVLG